MEVTGRVKIVGPVQEISASFKKRELIITTEEQYPQVLAIEFTQDKGDLINDYQPGELVRVSINLRGREWVSPQGDTRYFTSIQGWRIERAQQNAPQGQPYGYPPQQNQYPPQQGESYGNQQQGYAQQTPPPGNNPNTFPPAPNFEGEEPDDLPF